MKPRAGTLLPVRWLKPVPVLLLLLAGLAESVFPRRRAGSPRLRGQHDYRHHDHRRKWDGRGVLTPRSLQNR